MQDFICNDCYKEKMIEESYPKEAEKAPVTWKLTILHVVHYEDLPHQRAQPQVQDFASIMDDATGSSISRLCCSKPKTTLPPKFKELLPYAGIEKMLKAPRSVLRPKFTCSAFEIFHKEMGIDHDYSILFHLQ